jgi:RNA polymerase sigma factor (sigma-70 family)
MTRKQPFSEVVCLHGPTVLRVCRAMVGPVDADDAWSETFLSALRAYPELPEDANVEAWLVTIAHRKVIDLVRKAQRSATPLSDVPAQATEVDFDLAEIDLAQLVSRLPERQRLAVVYHYLGDLPYAEVAAVIGGTPEAARRAAADGIAKLRQDKTFDTHRLETQGTVE